MPETIVASVYYGAQQWTIRMGKYYVMGFGTSGPNQSPHNYWIEVDKKDVPASVLRVLGTNV